MNRTMTALRRTAALMLVLALAGCGQASDEQLLAEAQALLDKGELAAAQIQLKNALDRNPGSARARLLLGRVLLRSGDVPSALIELRRARGPELPDDQVVPELARAMLAGGEAAAVVGQFAGLALGDPAADAALKTTVGAAHAAGGNAAAARDAAQEALRRQPGHMPAIVLLAQLDLAGGDAAAALRRLDEALVKEPGHDRAGLLKGEILARDPQRLGDALQAFRAVVAAHPSSVPARAAIVNLLLLQGQAGPAQTEFEALRGQAPQHPETLLLQARLAFDAKDYAATREITSRLLPRQPRRVQLLMLAGAAEFQLQRLAEAEVHFSQALQAEPRQVAARQMLARIHLRRGAADKAVEVLRPATESARADAGSLALLGEAQLSAGDARQAEASLRRALAAAPGNPAVRTSLAIAQLAQGDDDKARSQLEALAREGRQPQADLALINAHLRRKDLKAALAAVDALARKTPDEARPLAMRARLQAQMGDPVQAAASYEQALAKQPGYFPAVAGLADLDLRSGRIDQARQRLEQLVKADPSHLQARLALITLDTQLGAPPAALAAQLREAVGIDPQQALPHLMLVDRLLSAGDAQAALSAAQDASAARPEDPAILDALGRAQLVAGDSARAVSSFRRLASMQPRKALHQVRLAEAHRAGGDRQAAAQALKRALELEPGLLMAERGLALLALADKKPADALARARAVQKRQPRDAGGFALEGELEGAQGNWAAAAAAYAAALQRAPSSEGAIRLHRALVATRKPGDAERMAADWLKQHPKDAAFLFHLGDQAAARKDLAQAEDRYRAVLALQPRHAVAMNNVAWLLVSQGKPGGTAMAEAALKLLPDRAPLLDTLALALEADSQLSKAVDAQRRATELDPRNHQLRLRLAKLLIKQGDRGGARDELDTLARLGKAFAGQDEVAALRKSL